MCIRDREMGPKEREDCQVLLYVYFVCVCPPKAEMYVNTNSIPRPNSPANNVFQQHEKFAVIKLKISVFLHCVMYVSQ